MAMQTLSIEYLYCVLIELQVHDNDKDVCWWQVYVEPGQYNMGSQSLSQLAVLFE